MAHHTHYDESEKNIRTAFFLNLFFTIIEFVGGFLTNSMAILSDAVHDLGDSFSVGLSWYFQRMAKKGRDEEYTYGYKRFSLLGAIINSLILIVGSVVILFNAVPRLFHPEQPDSGGMLILAVLGVAINGAAVLRLKRGHSLNERVISLHLLEDVLGWVAILIGALVMHFVDVPILDPILSVAITLYVLFHVYKNIKESLHIILQGAPIDIKMDEIEKEILSLDDVDGVHDLHIWSADGEYNVMTVHVVLKQALSMDKLHKLKNEIREKMQAMKIQHSTIEFETPGENCEMEECC
ncbi:MAG TPA: cation diffusion facilitator family transporter [Dysgonamonadaceae bacterium]|jgi:cobalt-zinc-cadmium efflux system protein|nr:cation diffusion facilitator family transporter [Dysgonamonadaceae bacterium]